MDKLGENTERNKTFLVYDFKSHFYSDFFLFVLFRRKLIFLHFAYVYTLNYLTYRPIIE